MGDVEVRARRARRSATMVPMHAKPHEPIVLAMILAGALVPVACTINPQPEPPGSSDLSGGTGGAAAAPDGGDFVGGSGGDTGTGDAGGGTSGTGGFGGSGGFHDPDAQPYADAMPADVPDADAGDAWEGDLDADLDADAAGQGDADASDDAGSDAAVDSHWDSGDDADALIDAGAADS